MDQTMRVENQSKDGSQIEMASVSDLGNNDFSEIDINGSRKRRNL
jgi:hypothetical protein